MEVMHLRAYPVSDFEQRAADISVNYPESGEQLPRRAGDCAQK